MIDLPELVLIKVLGYLPLVDQLNARQVCKCWQAINDHSVPRKEVILFLESLAKRPIRWLHDGREADLSNALRVNFIGLNSDFFRSYFRKIQRLLIVYATSTYELDTNVNYLLKPIQTTFFDLQHLQFSVIGSLWRISSILPPSPKEFCLQNLRTFYSETADVPLHLNCPNLTELFIYNDLHIGQTTREQTKQCIKRLRLLFVLSLSYPNDFEFSNLAVLHLETFPSSSLENFPLLEELHSKGSDVNDPGQLNDLFQHLLQQKRRLKRDRLKIFYRGFELKNEKAFFEAYNSYGSSAIDRLEFHGFNLNEKILKKIKEIDAGSSSGCNFSLTKNFFILNHTSDDRLVELSEGAATRDLLESINDIQIEDLSKIAPIFFEMSHRFRYVSSLFVCTDQLSQAQFDRLPGLLPHVMEFTCEIESFVNHLVNFNFLCRFECLNFISLHRRHISIDELKRILHKCKLLQDVAFYEIHDTVYLIISILDRKSKKASYDLEWHFRDLDEMKARATFDEEELFNYLAMSGWIKKADNLGELKPIYLRPF